VPSRDIGGVTAVFNSGGTLDFVRSFNSRALYAELFAEDFESGIPGTWTTSSAVTDVDWSTRTDSLPPGSSTAVSYWDGFGTYESFEGIPTGELSTPIISLPASKSQIRLFFDSSYETEDLDPLYYDTRVVFVYDDTKSTVLKTFGLAGEELLTWHKYEFDLSDLAGTDVIIGFAFD
jgi:hypothetical protein